MVNRKKTGKKTTPHKTKNASRKSPRKNVQNPKIATVSTNFKSPYFENNSELHLTSHPEESLNLKRSPQKGILFLRSILVLSTLLALLLLFFGLYGYKKKNSLDLLQHPSQTFNQLTTLPQEHDSALNIPSKDTNDDTPNKILQPIQPHVTIPEISPRR